MSLPTAGTLFVSVRDADKDQILGPVRELADQGFRIIATRGTKRHFDAYGIPCDTVNKVLEGRPHIVDMMKNGDISLVFNTTEGAGALADSRDIRRTALLNHIPCFTTLAAALAVSKAIASLRAGTLQVAPLQSYLGQPN
jgi:carbamoyl-phosphate synthase large subunit